MKNDKHPHIADKSKKVSSRRWYIAVATFTATLFLLGVLALFGLVLFLEHSESQKNKAYLVLIAPDNKPLVTSPECVDPQYANSLRVRLNPQTATSADPTQNLVDFYVQLDKKDDCLEIFIQGLEFVSEKAVKWEEVISQKTWFFC